MSTPVRRAIYGTLSSDSGAGPTTLKSLLGGRTPAQSIFHQTAPQDAIYPFVLFAKQAGTPTEAMQAPSAFENDVWLVKAVTRDYPANNKNAAGQNASPDDAVEAIAARIQTLLNDASPSISGASVAYLRRQSDVEYSEESDGVVYRHAGALYRLVFV